MIVMPKLCESIVGLSLVRVLTFFGKVGAYNDVFDCYISFPKDGHISLHADKNRESCHIFRHTPIITQQQYERHLAQKTLPYNWDDDLDAIGGYRLVANHDKTQNPVMENGWDDYGDAFENLAVIANHTFPLTSYPNGFSVIYDLGHTRLYLPSIKLSGANSATIDVISGEYIGYNRIRRTHNYCGGDRIISRCDTIDWMPTQLHGGRYLKLALETSVRM